MFGFLSPCCTTIKRCDPSSLRMILCWGKSKHVGSTWKTASSPMFFGGITSLPNDGAAAVVEELDVAGSSGGSFGCTDKIRQRRRTLGDLNDLLIDLSCNWVLLSDFFLGEFHTGTRFLTVLAEYTPTKKIPNNSEIPNQLTTNSMTLQAGSNSGPDPKKTYTLKSSKSPRLSTNNTAKHVKNNGKTWRNCMNVLGSDLAGGHMCKLSTPSATSPLQLISPHHNLQDLCRVVVIMALTKTAWDQGIAGMYPRYQQGTPMRITILTLHNGYLRVIITKNP